MFILDSLRVIGKHVVDFLLVLIELFSLGVTAEALREKIVRKSAISRSNAVTLIQNFRYKGTSLINHFCTDS